jgi:zinc protease
VTSSNPSAALRAGIGLADAERHVLGNGLTVLLRPVHHAPVATFWMWYRVGSRNERAGLTGISHWVEHMLFKGSERFPKGEVDRRIAREGGVFNGMTWLDWTTYFETLPAERIDLALDIEADRMAGALFDTDEVEAERTVIISEREGHENSPMFVLTEEIQSIAIKVHPYHHEVIGWKSDLLSMTRDDLWHHYRSHYHPGNAIAVAVGAFEPRAMLQHIRERFEGIPAGPAAAPVSVLEPEQRGERRVEIVGEDETPYVVVAYRAPAAADPDYFAFQVMDTVLGGAKSMNLFGSNPPNRSSRLYQALVEAELASAVSSGMAATIDSYLYTITGVVRDGATGASVEDAILREVERLRTTPITEAELETARKQSRAQFAYSAESVTNQGFWLGFAETIADQAWLAAHLSSLDAVTVADITRCAERWLSDRGRTVGHYVPASTRVKA